jgi:hypothetical protein
MYDLRQNSVLAEDFHAVGAARFGMLKTDQQGAIGGSTGTLQTVPLPPPLSNTVLYPPDFGNVTYGGPYAHLLRRRRV